MRCLVLGATGYIGTRLVPRLLAEGHRVRCLVRDPDRGRTSGWGDQVEMAVGALAAAGVLDRACTDTDVIYYLVHGMDGPDFAARDRSAAAVVAAAARQHGVTRIVYLAGLQPPADDRVSAHLASRREVGDLLLASGVPTVVLQAGVVLGSGSAGFEMIRHLAESLPVMPTPARTERLVQPIGIDDTLHYLLASLSLPAQTNRTFDIGGPDVLSYRDLSARYARSAGLATHVTLRIPEAPAGWTARAVEVLTPVDRHLAAPLLESMSHDMVCKESDLLSAVGPPPDGPTSVDEALLRALEQRGAAGDRPNDADGSGPTILSSQHVLEAAVAPERVWRVLCAMGGGHGWNTLPGVWAARGWLDGLLGGVGNRKIRPAQLIPGALWDSWQIVTVEPGARLLLRSQMRLPGRAELTLTVTALPGGGCRYLQKVDFRPSGLFGRAYWYAQLPAHQLVFGVMASTIVWRAEHGLVPDEIEPFG